MRNLFISLIFISLQGTVSSAQDLLGFENLSYNDKQDFKIIEPKALEAANFLLSTPIEGFRQERDKALKYMLMWMEGTPDYIFYVDRNIGLYTHSSNQLLSVYMACLTKNVLEDKVPANDREILKLRSIEMYMNYCLDPTNKVKPFKQLEHLVKARDKGILRKYIEE